MSEGTVHCARCGRTDAPALSRRPLPGAAGDEIRQRVCADCWAEWLRMEVMVINELRLNFMDPAAQETLNQHMRQFLFPAEGGGEAGGGQLPGLNIQR
ncbi:MAG TPA: oxidative damage protection protein [Thermoanaerobaculia bacterium]|nr:oxidative damage protection protein [Thermoanaerobaculia bacterium]